MPACPTRKDDLMGFYYMRPVHADDDGNLRAYPDQVGSVATDPHAAFKRYRLAFEANFAAKYGPCLAADRPGVMYAVWSFDDRPSHREAATAARVTPPHRVYVLIQPYGWRRVEFTLPDGVLVDVWTYRFDGFDRP